MPLRGEILELVVVEFWAIIRNQYFWDTMTSELHPELSNSRLRCLPVDLHYFKEIGPLIHHDKECLLSKNKQMSTNFLPRARG